MVAQRRCTVVTGASTQRGVLMKASVRGSPVRDVKARLFEKDAVLEYEAGQAVQNGLGHPVGVAMPKAVVGRWLTCKRWQTPALAR